MEPLLTRLLNLPGIVVENFRETETDLLLEVEAWTEKAVCPRVIVQGVELSAGNKDGASFPRRAARRIYPTNFGNQI